MSIHAISRIVREIVFICRDRNAPVSDTLAAFMARAVVLENPAQFPLDKELDEKDVQDLVKMATDHLLTIDSPSLEMVKMQVGFDTAGGQEMETLRENKEKVAGEQVLLKDISVARLKPGNDVEALTSLYRKIFNFLVIRAGHEAGHEREIAAALESVFPRIGLKAFTSLAAEDKVEQLHELANIVLGIRLFNRHIGKGGAGIQDVPRTAAELVASLVGQVGEDVEGVETLCQQYVDVIAHKYHSGATSTSDSRLARFQQELANRRQYLAYLNTLYSAFKHSGSYIEQLTRMLLQEMEALKQLVGSRSSVPKEQVYPRFDSLAKLWATFKEELALLQVPPPRPQQPPIVRLAPPVQREVLVRRMTAGATLAAQAREATLAELRTYTDSYVPTLRSDDLVAARSARRANDTRGELEVAALPPAELDAVLKAAGTSAAAVATDGEVAELMSEQEAVSCVLELEG